MRCSRNMKGQHIPLCWPWNNLLRKSLLGATLTDHLQAGDAQFTEFLFSCSILKLALFLFFCLRFAGGRTGYRHLVADVFGEFDGAAAQIPALAVLAGDGKLVWLVAFL